MIIRTKNSAVLLLVGVAMATASLGQPLARAEGPVPAPPLSSPALPSALPKADQTSTPSPACQFPPLAAGEVRTVDTGDRNTRDVLPPAVDPWMPCRMYRERAAYDTSLERFSQPPLRIDTVFHSPSIAVPTGGTSVDFLPSVPVIPSPGRVFTYDQASRWGVVGSDDAGYHWSERSPGSATPSPFNTLDSEQQRLVFAPSDPMIGYFAPPSSSPTLYRTGDGGRTWQQLLFSGPDIVGIAVDPRDATHAFVVTTPGEAASRWSTFLLWETRDTGAGWTATAETIPVADAQRVAHVYTAHSPAGLSLYIEIVNSATGRVWLQGSPSGPWKLLPLPVFDTASLAVDPLTGSGVWAGFDTNSFSAAGQQVVVIGTPDGFATTVRRTMVFPSLVPPDHHDGFRKLAVQQDRNDDVFLWLGNQCCESNSVASAIYAFRLSALTSSAAAPIVVPGPAGSSSGSSSPSGVVQPPPVAPAGPARQSCPLPVPVPAGGDVATPTGDTGGSLTFDGRYLDYAVGVRLASSAGVTGNSAQLHLIGRVDPATCAPAPAITLWPGDFPNGQVPEIEELTYAPDFPAGAGAVGALIVAGQYGSDPRMPNLVPLYALSPVTGHVLQVLFGVDTHLDPNTDATNPLLGDSYLSYDVFSGNLWSVGPQPDGTTGPGEVHLDGTPVPTCVSQLVNAIAEPDGQHNARQVATWTVGANHILYVQMEDDKTILRIDTAACRVVDGFQHATFGEPQQENEQLACDAITFSHGSAAAGSVLWVRDSGSSSAIAFPIPDGDCPFPTSLVYSGATAAVVGQQVPLCADLGAVIAGVRQNLAGQPVTFSLEGRPVGSSTTDSSGHACVTTKITLPPSGHAVEAFFAGTRAYLPSRAEAVLAVRGVIAPSGHQAGVPPIQPSTLSPPPSAVQPASQPGPQGQFQAEGQGQMQAQVQSQAQSQANAQSVAQVQPGVMPQRQRRTQVAVQSNAAGAQTLQASQRRTARGAPAPGVPMALMLLLGVVATVRRPRWSWARTHRPRRD